jgi:hypothetical protein
MNGHLHRGAFVALILVASSAFYALAEAPGSTASSLPDVRSGGVLKESYYYHRQQPVRGGLAGQPAGGWYGYGFPVSTFRWGWFGAEHYYPRVFWHEGYYGDCCRYSYRRGY